MNYQLGNVWIFHGIEFKSFTFVCSFARLNDGIMRYILLIGIAFVAVGLYCNSYNFASLYGIVISFELQQFVVYWHLCDAFPAADITLSCCGCDAVIICQNKASMAWQAVRELVRRCLRQRYSPLGMETPPPIQRIQFIFLPTTDSAAIRVHVRFQKLFQTQWSLIIVHDTI